MQKKSPPLKIIYLLGQLESRVKPSLPEFGKSLNPEIQTGRNQFHISFLQSVVHHTFVLLGQNGASRVNLNQINK